MARRSGLGRGLSALIPQEVGPSKSSLLNEVPLADIKPSRFQPRTHFDEEAMALLAALALAGWVGAASGLLSPLVEAIVTNNPRQALALRATHATIRP